ncbi:MAG: proton-conducting transporter transmembrane domain-containing protein [Arsenophonus sp. NEOnobi-MAG3]
MSQIGYMFLPLVVQAWDAVIFHLMVMLSLNLYFSSVTSVIVACQDEQNIFKMADLRKTLPFVYNFFVYNFLIGGRVAR